MSTIQIRELETAPGTKSFGSVTCGEWPDGTPIKMPLAIVNGSEPGPVFLAIGGMHGDEMVGTEAARRVAAELQPKDIRGSYIAVLAANLPAFILGTRVNTLEDPGGWNDFKNVMEKAQPTGSLTERLVSLLRDEIVPLCDYYADLHSSAKGSTNYPRAIVAGEHLELGDELRAKIDLMAEACNFEYIFKPRQTSWKGMYFTPSVPFEQNLGKAGIVLETGYAPTTADVDTVVEGLWKILAKIGITDGNAERTVPITYFERLVAVRADRGGMWHPHVELPHKAAEGELLGVITDLADNVIEEIQSPLSGIAVKVATTATVTTGTRAYVLGVPYQ